MDPTTDALLVRLGFDRDEVEAAATAVAALHAPARLGEVRALQANVGTDDDLDSLVAALSGGRVPSQFVAIGQLDDGMWHEEGDGPAPLALLVAEGSATLPAPAGDGDWRLCPDCMPSLGMAGGPGALLWILTELARLARASELAAGRTLPLATTVALLVEATAMAQAVYQEVFDCADPQVFAFAAGQRASLAGRLAAARAELAGRCAAALGACDPGPDRLVVLARGPLSTPTGTLASAAFGSVPVSADGDVALAVVPDAVAAVAVDEQAGAMDADVVAVLALDAVLPAPPPEAVAVAARLWQPGANDRAYGRLEEAVAAAEALHAA